MGVVLVVLMALQEVVVVMVALVDVVAFVNSTSTFFLLHLIQYCLFWLLVVVIFQFHVCILANLFIG